MNDRSCHASISVDELTDAIVDALTTFGEEVDPLFEHVEVATFDSEWSHGLVVRIAGTEFHVTVGRTPDND